MTDDPNLPPPPGGGFPPPPPPGGTPPPAQPPGPGAPPPGGSFPPPQPPGEAGGFGPPPAQPYGQGSGGGSGVGDAFQYGWTKFQQNIGQMIIAILVWIGVLIAAYGILWLLLLAFGAVGTTTNEFGYREANSLGTFGFLLTAGLGSLVVLAANFIGGAALLRVGLLVTKGDEISPSKLFSTENLGPYILTSLLVAVIVFVGSLVTCGLLGIVAAFFLLFAPFYSLDRGTAPMEAIRESVTLVNRNISTVVVLFIGAFIAYLIGAALCGIGLLVAYPVILIAYGYMYRQLNGEPIAP